MSISLRSIGFPSTLRILDQIDHGARRVTLRTQTTAASAPCPACAIPSRRGHGSYWRSLGDVACFGRPTLLLVRVRRFRCTAPAWPRRTFAEPLPGVAQARARQTDRLRAVHRTIGLALGGNPGARHAAAMGVPISRTTLLTRVRTGDAVPGPAVSVLGVDDWARCQGPALRHHPGRPILVDLERRRVVDLLPDRSADTLAAWLGNHPGVPAAVRDRAGAYAEGAARGAPDAIQVADRWHLLRNSSDALRTVVDQHHRDLRAAARIAAQPLVSDEPAVPAPGVPPEAERPMRAAEPRAAQDRRDARFAEVARLRGQGLSLKAIARTLGMGRKTVRRWLRAGQAPTWRHADRGTSILDPYQAYLEERWQAGCHNAAALWRDLKAKGFAGQPGVVRAWATRRRRQDPPAAPANMAGPPAASTAAEPATPRRAVRLLTGQPDTLGDAGRRFVAALSEPRRRHRRRSRQPPRDDGQGPGCARRLAARGGGQRPGAVRRRRGEDAVRAALTEPWGNGQVEGQVNRLKVIKREMYGRAGFDLLRCRGLGHA